MTLKEKILYLMDHGLKTNYIAKKCNCHYSTLVNYLEGNKPAWSTTEVGIERGIQDIINDFKTLMEQD